jgi:SAM-dependent methyltransferase
MNEATVELNEQRSLTDGYPNLERLGFERYAGPQGEAGRGDASEIVKCIDVLIRPTGGPRRAAVVGCGPNPHAVKYLLENGYDAIGVEPIEGFLSSARQALGDGARVVHGCAEGLPIESQSQHLIWMESVLEHVDSVEKSLAEAYRALVPGGLLYVQTTNRWRFSLLGRNDEFNIPFFNWFPATVKECYVFSHLHRKPRLANYAVRPAVHWFSYPDLCKYGREAGFAQFYSLIDVLSFDSPRLKRSGARRLLFRLARRNHWIKALALTQVGGTVFMWKRAK